MNIQEIEMNKIKTCSQQPRTYIDPQKIESLANDIKDHGLLQPIVVRKKEGIYEIVCGQRRYEAHKKLNTKTKQ